LISDLDVARRRLRSQHLVPPHAVSAPEVVGQRHGLNLGGGVGESPKSGPLVHRVEHGLAA
jgi:hypothetical protein